MASGTPDADRSVIVRTEGRGLFSAAETLLKGCLESDVPVDMLTGPVDTWFGAAIRAAREPEVKTAAAAHGLDVRVAIDSARAVAMALRAARSGRRAVAALANDSLHLCMPAIVQEAARGEWRRGAALLVIEDDPARAPWPSPQALLASAGAACLSVVDLNDMRGAIEEGLIISRADGRAAAVLVHASIIRSYETIECLPNRVNEAGDVDAMLLRRKRRRTRVSETDDVLRAARLRELNRSAAMPSPGERAEAGYIVMGPAVRAMRHVLHELDLVGRVPMLELSLVHPIDEPLVARFLTRCEQVVVLECRPGETEGAIIAVAESVRRAGERPATVWGRVVPAPAEATLARLDVNDALSASILARRLIHLLHAVRPTRQVASRLVTTGDTPRTGNSAIFTRRSRAPEPEETARQLLADVARDLAEAREAGDDEGVEVSLDAADVTAPRRVRAEVWSGREFLAEGRGALQQAQMEGGRWLFIACTSARADGAAIERVVHAASAFDSSTRVTVRRVMPGDASHARDAIREACQIEGVNVVVIDDAAGPDADDHESETLAEIDRQGFQRVERLVQRIDEACNIRQARAREFRRMPALADSAGGVDWSIDHLDDGPTFMLRVRPMAEWVQVVRSKPRAAGREGAARSIGLPPPRPVHARQEAWRAHLAGVRGESPGIAVRILCEAGVIQGYDVGCEFDRTRIRRGRAAWAQVLFTPHEPQRDAPALTIRAPYGEAHLVVGVDPLEAAAACAPERGMRVAQPGVTTFVLDRGAPAGAGSDDRAAWADVERLVHAHSGEGALVELDASTPARTAFGTDRPTDLILLGAAFQRGLIPLSIKSIDAAIDGIESRGFLRCREAFVLGRSLAAEIGAPQPPSARHSAEQAARRAEQLLRLEGGRFRRMARDFRRLVREGLDAMPGLGESEAGRQSQIDFVAAMARCVRWGGLSHARRYRALLTALYAADRGDSGRALTRHAVLPLAEAMLIRDLEYIATMAASREAERLIRRRLHVHRSRGDELTRRFISRVELTIAGRRLRLDVRTSDWPAVVSRRIAFLRPNAWRGSADDRARLREVIAIIEHATREAADDYEKFDAGLFRLHRLALLGRLRRMSAAGVRRVFDGAESKQQRREDDDPVDVHDAAVGSSAA